MTDQGPTTVGSIVGKLRLDRDQWVAAVALTKKDIAELEGANPKIDIDTNAGKAIAEMEAAAVAADALGAKEEQLGQKTRKATEETVKANEANRTSVTRVGAIASAIALLVPLLAPVAAGAIGIGSAMLGMGAAGVLAIIGIKREMEDGTAIGDAYRSGVDELKGSLDVLSRTSAVAMLASFQRVVAETRDSMPFLNTQVGQFSTLLGRSGANLFTGTINALRVLNPLFLTAGVYLETLTKGFEDWTNSGGIETFGGYALAALPQVIDLLGSLASMVMHILEALAPLGTIGMAVLGGIADLINTIPVDILSDLIVTITWGAIAFKAWGFIAPMLATIASSMGAVGVATTIATGPIGWVVAGLSALAGIFAVTIAANTGATQAMQDYTAAVQADSGAIGENVRQKAAQKNLDAGAYDAAKKLGIATTLVTEATLGNKDAQKLLAEQLEIGTNGSKKQKDQLDKTGLGLVDYGLAVETVKQAVDSNSVAIEGEVNRYKTLQDALGETTNATAAQQAADEAAAAALGITTGSLQAAQTSQGDMKTKTDDATAAMYVQNDAAGLLKQTLDLLNGKTLDAAGAQNRFDSQIANMGAHIDKTGKDVDRATASLEGMSAAAVANRGELISSVEAAQTSAQAFRDQGGSAEETRQKLINMKTSIIEQAVAVGENRDQVTSYVNELFKIPESLPKTKVEVDTATAAAKLQALVDGYNNKSITLRALVHGVDGSANGGTIRGLAAGGTAVGPGTSKSDSILHYLSTGEEVIQEPMASRNRGLLKAINAGYVAPTAAVAGVARATSSGAAAAAGSRQPREITVNVHVTTVQNEDPRVLSNIIGREAKSALAGAFA